MKKLVTKEQLDEVVREVLDGVRPSNHATVLLLEGNLGAGKTTFTQALARELGYSGDVVSPTFVIQKSYAVDHPLFRHLIHIDAYRLEGAGDIQKLGFDSWLLDRQNLIVIEWPSIIAEAIPPHAITITFEHVDESIREISIDYA